MKYKIDNYYIDYKQTGNQQSFKIFYVNFYNICQTKYQSYVNQIKQYNEFEDILHDTLVKLLLSNIDGKKGSVTNYAITIFLNRIKDIKKSAGNNRELPITFKTYIEEELYEIEEFYLIEDN